MPVSSKLYKISSLFNHSEAVSVEVVFPAILQLTKGDFISSHPLLFQQSLWALCVTHIVLINTMFSYT